VSIERDLLFWCLAGPLCWACPALLYVLGAVAVLVLVLLIADQLEIL